MAWARRFLYSFALGKPGHDGKELKQTREALPWTGRIPTGQYRMGEIKGYPKEARSPPMVPETWLWVGCKEGAD